MHSKDVRTEKNIASSGRDAKKDVRRQQTQHHSQAYSGRKRSFDRVMKFLLQLPLVVQLMLGYIIVILLTNHIAITDLINLIKAVKS